MKIAIIGVGNMGAAIARGLAKTSLIMESDITVSDPSNRSLDKISAEFPLIKCTTKNQEAVDKARIIILAVKPWLVDDLIAQIKYSMDYKKQIVISVAAGISCEDLSKAFRDDHAEVPVIYRAIPNIAFEKNESITFLSTQNASPSDNELVLPLFEACGKAVMLNEKDMVSATALGSCGIAFAFRYVHAVMSAGVELGIAAPVSKDIAIQTLKGAVSLLEQSNEHPEALVNKVTTPGGITIKGVNELEHNGFTSAVINAYKACK
ncbi:MAG: pyrroline-5-carboxylate reductase [Bacteroidales bacterium]